MSDEDFFATPSNDESQQEQTDDMFGATQDDQQQAETFDSFASEDNQQNQFEDQAGFDSYNNDTYQEAPMSDFEQQQEQSYTEPPKQVSAIREYEEKRYNALLEKDNESRQHHDKILEDAKNFKAKCIKDREERKQSNLKKNKEDEELFRSNMEAVHDNVWENVMKFVDLNKAKTQNKLDKELDDMDEQILNKKKKKKNQKEEEPKIVKKVDLVDLLQVEQKDTTRLRKILLELKAEAPAH